MRFLTIISLNLLNITALFAFVILAGFSGPVIPPATTGQIKSGMTNSDVLKILGPPDNEKNLLSWEYTCFLNPGRFVIQFDELRNVDHVINETGWSNYKRVWWEGQGEMWRP